MRRRECRHPALSQADQTGPEGEGALVGPVKHHCEVLILGLEAVAAVSAGGLRATNELDKSCRGAGSQEPPPAWRAPAPAPRQ